MALGGWSWLVLVLDDWAFIYLAPAGARKLLGDITDFVKFRYTPIIKRKKHSVGGCSGCVPTGTPVDLHVARVVKKKV